MTHPVETHRKAINRIKHNGWKLRATTYMKGGARLDVTRKDGSPLTLKATLPRQPV